MPQKLRKPCGYPGCPAVVDSGERYCERHKADIQKQYDRDRGSAASRGYDARWKRLRLMALAQEPLCRECLSQGRARPATDVHHIDGDVRNMKRENLEPLCKECHSRKTAKYQAFGRG